MVLSTNLITLFPESHKEHAKYEDMDMILADFDNDGDKDLVYRIRRK